MEGKTLPVYHILRHEQGFLKSIATVVLVAFVSLCLQPLALAAQLPAAAPAHKQAPSSNDEKLTKTIDDIEDRLDKLETRLTRNEDATKDKDELKRLRKDLDEQDQQAMADFEKIGQHLKDKNLPKVILDRHSEAVNTYKTEMAALKANVDDVEKVPKDEDKKLKAAKAKTHLKDKNKKRARTKFDPNDMPNKSLQPNPKNKPKLKKEDFVRAALFDNPGVRLAALGDFTYDRLPGASDPAYLATSAEVVLTDAIKAKAQELGHDPVKIYQWVRNNVEWLPTWGATQDADVTLGSKRGNALDIASLTIALYRASGIPARYVHGAIEVPEDKFRNWAGGFTNVTAAANFASSGGIPVTTFVSGGKISKVQLEHIWVEAAIDFQPSRGAINKAADRWVQLDPSYKQRQEFSGLDLAVISGTDPTTMVQSYLASGTLDQSGSWVMGLNAGILETTESQVQLALSSYLTTNLPTANIGNVNGDHHLIQQSASVLSATLPYRVLIVGARYGAFPRSLQNSMTLALGFDELGEPINPVRFPLARLNNHKITFSYRPASQADEQTLVSLIPNGLTDLTSVPTSIPAYLVSVIPRIAVDGQVVSEATARRLGEDVSIVFGVESAGNTAQTPFYEYRVPTGSYLNVPIIAGNVSVQKVLDLQVKLSQTHSILTSIDLNSKATLTAEDITGDVYYGAGLSYFAQYVAMSQLIGVAGKSQHNLPIGYGSMGYEPRVRTLFGIPMAIERGSFGVNIRLHWAVASLAGDSEKTRQMAVQSGLLSSALEHLIPEQILSEEQPGEGVSAVKALVTANAQGQQIYHLTPVNQAVTLSNLHLGSLVMDEITAALAVGKEVIAHTQPITISGWAGAGYIILDPVTGAGAYKITGGRNGGDFPWGGLARDLVGAGLDIGIFLDRVADSPDPLKVFRSLDKIVNSLVKGIVKSTVIYAGDTSRVRKLCLTQTQADSLLGAISSLNQLSWIGRVPGLNLPPGVAPALLLGQYLGYMVVLFHMLHFMQLNEALDDC